MNMLELKLAFRNLLGGKLRTLLNVGALSFCYVLIIGVQGIYEGMLRQGMQDKINDEIGGGQYWGSNYDPNDPISLDDSSAELAPAIKLLVESGNAAPVLIRQASIFPGGRIQSILLKGIDPGQKVLNIPTAKFNDEKNAIPALIGTRMAKRNAFKPGDYITIRFRDAKGTFDAIEVKITGIIDTNVPTIDSGQVWLPLEELRKLTGLSDKATIVVVAKDIKGLAAPRAGISKIMIS